RAVDHPEMQAHRALATIDIHGAEDTRRAKIFCVVEVHCTQAALPVDGTPASRSDRFQDSARWKGATACSPVEIDEHDVACLGGTLRGRHGSLRSQCYNRLNGTRSHGLGAVSGGFLQRSR